MDYVDINFRAIMVLLAVLNFFLAFFAESVIVDYLIFIRFKEYLRKMTSSQTMFDKIFNQTRNTDWLPKPYDHMMYDPELGGKSGDLINSCQVHGSVRFTNSMGKLNGYTNTALDNEDDDRIKNRDNNQIETIIDINHKTKSSPSESGICIMSPMSAPASPPSNYIPQNESDLPILQSKPVYKSMSNIPFDTNGIIDLGEETQSVHGFVSETQLGTNNPGFVRNDSLVLIQNEETRDEDSDGKPILNGNSSDVLI